RDLSSFVRNSDIFVVYNNISHILLNLNVPMNRDIQTFYENNLVENYSVNLGIFNIHSILGIVGRNSLLAANYIKWNTLYIRPEALGIEIERIFKDGCNKYNISNELLRNRVLNAVRSLN